ncbi:ATP-grasp domain-containing protein [Rathayibacter sp. KR2-224]|uniref:ATP-grasp domain-containing protein n=1 Tax=Rathayibacter sp. KR2-224 TaxID=3400913 RepID=UPI003C12729E
MASPDDRRRPRLGFVFHPRSFGTLAIVDAARNLCDVVWLVDTADARLGSMTRLLARVGTVVDVAGVSGAEAAQMVRDERLDGVLALADDLLEWTAELADRLGLPFHSVQTARLLTDKFAQRSALRAAGLPAPRSWVLHRRLSEDEWMRVAEDEPFPGVLKPRQGEGSRNTNAVGSIAEVRSIVAGSGEAEHGSEAREWVLEEYIEDVDAELCGEGFANYVSVESFVAAGQVTTLAITGRTPPARPFRETGFFIPAAISQEQAGPIVDAATAAAHALGITVGCLHTEVKLTPTGPVVIEVNGRIGGGVPELLDLTTGIDFLGIALRLALGESVEVGPVQPNGLGYLLYVQARDDIHRITAVTGLDDLRVMPGVQEVVLNRGPGHAVDWRDGNHGHVYSVLGTAGDHDGLRAAIGRVTELVRIDGV